MIVVLDNNLPWRMVDAVRKRLPDVQVCHVSDLDMSDLDDAEIRRRMANQFVVWLTRDEDFWLDTPPNWAVVWVDCHNPRLAFLRQGLVPVIAEHIPRLSPGSRLWVTEDLVSLV